MLEPLLIAATLFAGGALQGAVGFAYTLLALPLLLWLGLPLRQAVTLIVVSILFQAAHGAWRLRAHIAWREVAWASAVRYAGLPLGLAVLHALDAAGALWIKPIVGALLLAVLGALSLLRVPPRERVHPGWGWASFAVSGFLQGVAAVGGPALVLWVMAHTWTNRRSRAFLFACFLFGLPVQLGLLLWTYGAPAFEWALAGLAYAPLVVLGSAAGVRLGDRLSTPLLRGAAYAVLFLVGMASILAPWIEPR